VIVGACCIIYSWVAPPAANSSRPAALYRTHRCDSDTPARRCCGGTVSAKEKWRCGLAMLRTYAAPSFSVSAFWGYRMSVLGHSLRITEAASHSSDRLNWAVWFCWLFSWDFAVSTFLPLSVLTVQMHSGLKMLRIRRWLMCYQTWTQTETETPPPPPPPTQAGSSVEQRSVLIAVTADCRSTVSCTDSRPGIN